MTGRQRERGHGQRHGFLDGPAVAALFRAARRTLPTREASPPRNFAVSQSASHPIEAKI